MPTILEMDFGRIKVVIYFKDHDPPHVHAIAPGCEARFAIESLELLSSSGFTRTAIGKIRRYLGANQWALIEAWNVYKD